MEIEKRKHPRFKPHGVRACIRIGPISDVDDGILLEGEVVDISYRGIKIRLNQPLHNSIDHGEIKIDITMPQSGVPISIHGLIKHIREHHECGLQFAGNHSERCVDKLMFECIKLADHSVQI